MWWYVGSRDITEWCIYYIAICDCGRLDVKPQKISSSSVTYCIEIDTRKHMYQELCRKKRQHPELHALLGYDTDFSWLPHNLLKWPKVWPFTSETLDLVLWTFLEHFAFVHKNRIKLCWVVQAHTVTDLHNIKSPVQQLSPEVPSQRS